MFGPRLNCDRQDRYQHPGTATVMNGTKGECSTAPENDLQQKLGVIDLPLVSLSHISLDWHTHYSWNRDPAPNSKRGGHGDLNNNLVHRAISDPQTSPAAAQRKENIPIRINLGFIQMSGLRVIGIGPIMNQHSGLPALLKHVASIQHLQTFQETYLPLTYDYHNLSTQDVSCYRFYVHSSSTYQLFGLGLFRDEAGLQRSLHEVRQHYHTHDSCDTTKFCFMCHSPPMLFIYFDLLKLQRALSLQGLSIQQDVLNYYDWRHEQLARQLSQHDRRGADLYNKMCENAAVRRQFSRFATPSGTTGGLADITGPVALTPQTRTEITLAPITQTFPPRPHMAAQDGIPPERHLPPLKPNNSPLQAPKLQVGHDPFAKPSLPPWPINRSQSSVSAGAAPLTPTGSGKDITVDDIRGPLGKRLFAADSKHRPVNPEKFAAASEKPVVPTKAETDQCLTCINRSIKCKGTQLIAFNSNLNDIRCENCAKKNANGGGSRKCYWKDEANGILTFDQAKLADPKAKWYHGNTRAAKEQRAKQKVAELLVEQMAVSMDVEKVSEQRNNDKISGEILSNTEFTLGLQGNGADTKTPNCQYNALRVPHLVEQSNEFTSLFSEYLTDNTDAIAGEP